MKSKKPKTISIKKFSHNFTNEQNKLVSEEIRYYDLLASFRAIRKKKGLSQEELAKKANLNRTTLSKVETGLRNATINTLMKIANAMDMKLDIKLNQ